MVRRGQKGKSLAGFAKALAPVLLPALGSVVGQVADAGGARLAKMISGQGIKMAGRGKKRVGRPRKAKK